MSSTASPVSLATTTTPRVLAYQAGKPAKGAWAWSITSASVRKTLLALFRRRYRAKTPVYMSKMPVCRSKTPVCRSKRPTCKRKSGVSRLACCEKGSKTSSKGYHKPLNPLEKSAQPNQSSGEWPKSWRANLNPRNEGKQALRRCFKWRSKEILDLN